MLFVIQYGIRYDDTLLHMYNLRKIYYTTN